jgi:hypothetical protein
MIVLRSSVRATRLATRLAVVVLIAFAASRADAGMIHVGGGQTYTTIEDAYAVAQNGDTILIDDGVYTFSSTLLVQKQLTFEAVNVGGAVVSGGGYGPDDAVFKLGADASFIGLRLENATHGLYQRDAGAHGYAERLIITGTTEAIGINNSGGTSGSFDVVNCTIYDVSTGFNINDGGTINIKNTILANVIGGAYVAHNNISINPDHDLLYNVGVVSGTTSSGHVSSDPAQIIGDPLFVNAGGGDFRLSAGSPAIDSGANVGLSYNGLAPDRGAFEYNGAGSPATVPEPSSLVVCSGLGIAGIVMAWRRRRRGGM